MLKNWSRSIKPVFLWIAVVGACGGDDPTPSDAAPPATIPDNSGTIAFLKAADKDGVTASSFQVNHTMKVTVGFVATDEIHDHSVYVGMVEKVTDGMDRTTAHSCELGAFNAHYALDPDDPNRTYNFENEFLIPQDCLPEGTGSVTMNLWVATDPQLSGSDDDPAPVPPGDLNTQFFNAAGEDTEGEARNQQCKTENGTPGCAIDIQISPSNGDNITIDKIHAESNVATLPADCEPDFADPPIEVSGELRILGTASHDGMTETTDADNVLAKAHGGAAVQMSYRICPAGDPPSSPTQIHSLGCAAGTDWVPLKLLGENHEDAGTFEDAAMITELVNGEPYVFSHALFMPPGTAACKNMTGAVGAAHNWSGYGSYYVAACVTVPFDEQDSDGDAIDDNCAIFPVRVVVNEAQSASAANSYSFTKDWDQQWGNSVVSLSAQMGTQNNLTLSGATAYAYGKANMGGWVNFNVLDVEANAAAYVAITGSGYSASIDVVGSRLWGVAETVPVIDKSWQQNFSKQGCGSYNYGVAGLGLNATLCAIGNVGLTSNFHVKAVSGAGNPPFDTSQEIGEVQATATPYANMQLSATASANIGVAMGGITGNVTLIQLSLPATATLDWGLTSLSPLALTIVGNANLDLQITTLNGSISGFADVLQPAWCKCSGWWCPGYPCTSWSNVWNADLVNFSGFVFTQNLLALSAQTTLQ